MDRFFGFLFKLDNRTKKKLIIKLTDSIDDGSGSKKKFSELFGGWKDTRSTDEIISNIRNSRTPGREMEDFE